MLLPMQEVQEGPLEKKMATRSSILAWEIPWTEELGLWGHKIVGHDLTTKQQQIGRAHV